MKCEKCGGENLAFTEGVKGDFPITIWILTYLIIIIGAFAVVISFLITNNLTFSFILFVLLIIFALVMKIKRYNRRRKTITKAVCKDCGHIWELEK